jgi:hypothetical protein
MRFPAFLLILLLSLPLAAKRGPRWKEGDFKTTASGLQYKIMKEGKGDSIGAIDAVLVELYRFNSTDHALIKDDGNTKDGKLINLEDKNKLPGIIQCIRMLKRGGKGYFKIPPSPGNNDTLYCYIVIKNVFHNVSDRVVMDTVPGDSVKFKVTDPNKKYFGDTLIALMKLVEQPQIVSCGDLQVLIAFKFEMTYFENGTQRKNIVIFIECPESYGKDYFVAGKSYMITCVPLLDDLKDGKRTMNSYSLEKLDRYYGLRVTRMGN